MGWEKRGMFRNVKALISNDWGTRRRGENHTTTISSPVSRKKEFLRNQKLFFLYSCIMKADRKRLPYASERKPVVLSSI